MARAPVIGRRVRGGEGPRGLFAAVSRGVEIVPGAIQRRNIGCHSRSNSGDFYCASRCHVPSSAEAMIVGGVLPIGRRSTMPSCTPESADHALGVVSPVKANQRAWFRPATTPAGCHLRPAPPGSRGRCRPVDDHEVAFATRCRRTRRTRSVEPSGDQLGHHSSSGLLEMFRSSVPSASMIHTSWAHRPRPGTPAAIRRGTIGRSRTPSRNQGSSSVDGIRPVCIHQPQRIDRDSRS